MALRAFIRGHVYWVNLPSGSSAVGSEQYGRRPWIIVSTKNIQARLPIVIGVPTTSKTDKDVRFEQHRLLIPEDQILPMEGKERLLHGDSLALTEQIRVLSVERLEEEPVGFLTTSYMTKLEACLAYVLELP